MWCQIELSPFGHFRNDHGGARRGDRAREANQLGVRPPGPCDPMHDNPPGQRRDRGPRSQKGSGNGGAVAVQHDLVLQQLIPACQPGPSVPEGSGKRDCHGESYPRPDSHGHQADDVDGWEE